MATPRVLMLSFSIAAAVLSGPTSGLAVVSLKVKNIR
jgi:hypothetical protein